MKVWVFVATHKYGASEARVIGHKTKKSARRARQTMKYTGIARHRTDWDVGPVVSVHLPSAKESPYE